MFGEHEDPGKQKEAVNTDKFKGLLIAFILGNVIIWMVPTIMVQMDPCLLTESEIGFLPVLQFGGAAETSADRPRCGISLDTPSPDNGRWEGEPPITQGLIDSGQISYASATSHALIQTILFVVKIIMVLGVIGAVGIMRLGRSGFV